MKKSLLIIFLFCFTSLISLAQCSMCTKTAASLDDNSARGLNSGILYLAALPLIMMGFVGFKWYKQNKE